jgi:hypothetical protein
MRGCDAGIAATAARVVEYRARRGVSDYTEAQETRNDVQLKRDMSCDHDKHGRRPCTPNVC